MRSIRASSLVRGITAVAVFFALCGMSIRLPLPLNSAGAVVRAKRARRTETAAELAAQAALAEQAKGSTRRSAASAKDLATISGVPTRLKSLSGGWKHRSHADHVTASLGDGSQRLLPLRC
jgi:hypothetical protein